MKKQYVQFVYDLYRNDPSFVGSSVFELETYLYQRSRHAREVFSDAVMVQWNGEIKAVSMFFFTMELPYLQIGFFEARKDSGNEVDAILKYASERAKLIGAKKIVVGINAHPSVGVGILNYKPSQGPIAFDSIYSKLYYPDFFRKRGFTESNVSTYKAKIDDILDVINGRSIEFNDISVRPMNKRYFRKEIDLMTRLSNEALSETEMFYPITQGDLFERLRKIKFLLRTNDLLFVMKNGREIGYLFTHPDFNQALPAGKKLGKLQFVIRVISGRKKINTLKVNSICMTEKRYAGLHQVIKFCTLMARKQGFTEMESNFIFDSNRQSLLFALSQGFRKSNTYSIFYREVENA